MTQTSYYWQGISIGDASLASYNEDEFLALFLRTVLLQDATLQAPIDGYANSLLPTKTGTTVYLDTGAAIVYGFLYENTSQLSFDATAAGYYRLVLRVSWAAKTVRAVLLGPDGGALPALTQTAGVTYEVNLCDIHSTGAALDTFTDKRVMTRPNSYRMPRLRTRYGDNTSNDWSLPATITNLTPIRTSHTTHLVAGCIEWTGVAANNGSVVVTYPVGNTAAFVNKPVAFAVCNNPTVASNVILSVVPGLTSMTIYWKTRSGSNETVLWFNWLAFGYKQRGA